MDSSFTKNGWGGGWKREKVKSEGGADSGGEMRKGRAAGCGWVPAAAADTAPKKIKKPPHQEIFFFLTIIQ